MALDGNDEFKSGYNKGVRDAIKIVDACKDIEMIAIRGKYLNDLLAEQISGLEKS
jgi:hypothetical protein